MSKTSASDGTRPRIPMEKFYQAACVMMILGTCSMMMDLLVELGATALMLGILLVLYLDDVSMQNPSPNLPPTT